VPEKHLSQSKTDATSQETSSTKATFLAHNPLFKDLSAQEREDLEHAITLLPCPAGRILYHPGELATSLFFLQSGRIQLYHLSTDGRKLVTATFTADACFGELPLFHQSQHHSFAEAIEESTLYFISRHDIEHLLLQHSSLAFAFLHLLSQRFLQLETQLINTTFKSTSARLAALLLELARPDEKASSHLEVVGLSHEELAERLGVYRETVSTALRDLKGVGAISLGRKKIILQEPTRLAAIAEAGNKGNRNT
jgi:CRP-like cAMP-binding protein